MLETYNYSKKRTHDLATLFKLVENIRDSDFYYTENNQRLYITEKNQLKRFLNGALVTYVSKDIYGDIHGLATVIKSEGGEVKRYYVKMCSEDPETAENLLTALSWNLEVDLYAKVKKNSPFLGAYKRKGFKFVGGRGRQILLRRYATKIITEFKGEDLENGDND